MSRHNAIVPVIIVLLLTVTPAYLIFPGAQAASGQAAEWSRSYGGPSADFAFSLIRASDGGYLIGGWTDSFGTAGNYGVNTGNLYLIRTDEDGSKERDLAYGGNDSEMSGYVQESPGGGYVLAGNSGTPGLGPVYVVRTDTQGNVLWEKALGAGEDRWVCSLEKAKGGYLLTGRSSPRMDLNTTIVPDSSVYLLKIGLDGTELWNRTYDVYGLCGYAAIETSDGGCLVVGGRGELSANGKMFMLKTGPDGAEEWLKYYGDVGDGAKSVIETVDGFVVTGNKKPFFYREPGQSTDTDVYLVKTDKNGTVLWEKTFGGNDTDYGESLVQTEDGGYAIVGSTILARYDHYVYDVDICLLRTDKDGNLLWRKTFGGPEHETGIDIVKAEDSSFVIAGDFAPDGGNDQAVLLIKTDDAPGASTPIDDDLRSLEFFFSKRGDQFLMLTITFVVAAVLVTALLLLVTRSRRKK